MVWGLLLVATGCRERACPPAPSTGSEAVVQPSPLLDAQPAPTNPVQVEMRLMTQILEVTVRAIGARDVRPIEHELHRLHAAKEATSAAVTSGAYKLPKNADNVAGFTAMDEAFHEDLGALVTASRANDVPGAAEALGAIMRGCQGCHAAYRP